MNSHPDASKEVKSDENNQISPFIKIESETLILAVTSKPSDGNNKPASTNSKHAWTSLSINDNNFFEAIMLG